MEICFLVVIIISQKSSKAKSFNGNLKFVPKLDYKFWLKLKEFEWNAKKILVLRFLKFSVKVKNYFKFRGMRKPNIMT